MWQCSHQCSQASVNWYRSEWWIPRPPPPPLPPLLTRSKIKWSNLFPQDWRLFLLVQFTIASLIWWNKTEVCIYMYMSILFFSQLQSRVTCSACLPRVLRSPAKHTRKITLVLRGQSGVSLLCKSACAFCFRLKVNFFPVQISYSIFAFFQPLRKIARQLVYLVSQIISEERQLVTTLTGPLAKCHGIW